MPIDRIDRLVQSAKDASIRLRVRSALNPMLWLCGIGGPSCFGFGLLYTGFLQAVLVWTGISIIAVGCIGFLYLLIFDRDKLQSEDYQIRKQALDIIEEKGGRLPLDSASVELIANPELPTPKTGAIQ